MIIGQPGAGKSTLAREVADVLHLPVFHVDHIHWLPGWVERDRDEKVALAREVHAMDRWVFEGGLASIWNERLERAEALIWLDFPVSTRLWRIARRYRAKGPRPDLPPDCPERWDPAFLRYVWRTRRSGWARCEAAHAAARGAGKKAFRLRGPKAVRGLLHGLRYAAETGRLGG
ncbi:AAA family ATPase [Jannaschia sp. LMIT008]|uniref:AAA family ATPase n=1 Tax=Jannaschia maritima TaxID=3032585 RepID=UPI002811D9A0|nr:AAA family ATPase [Jannaschia sp. LMIT008]